MPWPQSFSRLMVWARASRCAWVAFGSKETVTHVAFNPKATQAQRDALAPIILKTYGLEWGELKVQEAPIEIKRIGDIAEAKLGDGKLAYMKLKREPGADGSGVVLKNVKYFGAQSNNGFELYKSLE